MYQTFFSNQIDKLHAEGRYRVFNELTRYASNPAIAVWHNGAQSKNVVVWCSNDYLGLSANVKIIDAARQALQKHGAGSGGTRNISGTNSLHVKLENAVALFHQKEAGLLFTSGYSANEATLSTLGKYLPNVVFFCDSNIHASMIQGVKHSGCAKHIFKHNDLIDLEQKLKSYPIDTPKIIAIVSVYSMDGDFAPLAEIVRLAKKYNALTYLDEVHGMGIYGNSGAGLAEALNLSDQIDIIQANFAKAGGIIGGYITGTKACIDFIRGFASGFIFTTSLPPMVTAAAIKSIEIIQSAHHERELLLKRANYLKQQLLKTGFNILPSPSHIVALIVGDAVMCKQLSDTLLNDYNIYLQPINYPTVAKGQERFRITVTPFHSEQMIDELVNALIKLHKIYNISMAAAPLCAWDLFPVTSRRSRGYTPSRSSSSFIKFLQKRLVNYL